MKEQFPGVMVRIHFGEDDKWRGQPLHEVILARCREVGVGCATVYRGVEGYGTSTRIRRTSLLSFSKDAPMVVSVVDTEEKIKQLLPQLDELVEEGMIATSQVEVIRYS